MEKSNYMPIILIFYFGQNPHNIKTKMKIDFVKVSGRVNNHKLTLNTDKYCFLLITIAMKPLLQVDALELEIS